jgi:hypothetical protein
LSISILGDAMKYETPNVATERTSGSHHVGLTISRRKVSEGEENVPAMAATGEIAASAGAAGAGTGT